MKYLNVVMMLLLVVCASIIAIGYTENQELKKQLKQTQNDLYSVQDNLSKSQKEFYLTKNELTLTAENLSTAKKTLQKDESDWGIVSNYTAIVTNANDVIGSYNEVIRSITVWDYSHRKEYQALYDKNQEIMKLDEAQIAYITDHRDVFESRFGKAYVKNLIKAIQDVIISEQKTSDNLKQWISWSSTAYYT